MTTSRTKLMLIATTAFVAVVGILLWYWYFDTCLGPSRLSIKAGWFKDFEEPVRSLGCAELWFNRYQTFLGNAFGGVLAVVAALLAGFFALQAAEHAAAPVRAQLQATRDQIALQAYPLILQQIEDLEMEDRRRSSALEQSRRIAWSLRELDQATVELELPNVATSALGHKQGIEQLLGSYREICRRRPTYQDAEDVRDLVDTICTETMQTLESMAPIIERFPINGTAEQRQQARERIVSIVNPQLEKINRVDALTKDSIEERRQLINAALRRSNRAVHK